MGKICGDEGWISLGPWGGKYGEDWAYKAVGPIMQITIGYNIFIESILFERKCCDGVVVGSFGIGCSSIGGATRTFCIDSSIEQLSSISLTYGGEMIVSLCFETNIGNKYGPFGPGSGASSVSIPVGGGVITGFHGRYGSFLSAIGIFVAPKVNSLPSSGIKVDSLHSIQDADFAPTQLEFCIDSSVEQLSFISLTYGDYYGQVAIRSLCFETDIGNKYGPFGTISGASSQSVPIEGGVTVGFHGHCGTGTYLTAIGIFVAPKVNNLPSTSGEKFDSSHSVQDPNYAPTQLEIKNVVNKDNSVHEDINLEGLEFCIDTSEEQLTSISLTYAYFHGKVRITTLCFNTNLNKYGPFGSRLDHYSESIPIEGGVFGGFHGRTDDRYIAAIGIFVPPKVNHLHSIQDPDSAPIQLKDNGVCYDFLLMIPTSIFNILDMEISDS
ncbi:hypothetical protein RHGRI_033471 [Rhododendron griersonianum]|uniref:Jacalin-type lectin domain-containing protein n=1 Tax=Rhododendron griersonianum TaxID=479676 RepID=A0AAV6HXC5_9ERIC|nr:hypothetical protein RHGRI_033471 [Rhododendron griersonianum]